MAARVVTVGDDTFRSIALIAVADIPLFPERSCSVRPFRFRMLLSRFPTSIMSGPPLEPPTGFPADGSAPGNCILPQDTVKMTVLQEWFRRTGVLGGEIS